MPKVPPLMLADADARERILTDLESTLLLEAAARKGNTTMPVARMNLAWQPKSSAVAPLPMERLP